ncbi:MAG: metal-dependent hydrolase [Pseudomonadales bacterium]|nr:metal-dependent hydrolase [Pseudomonadales bacterium]
MKAQEKIQQRPRLTSASVGIPPRHLNFKMPDNKTKYLVANNATATMFLVMLSAFFPPGERFFVESVRHFRSRAKDPALKAAIAGFIGQEAIHSREHERLNKFLTERGFDTTFPEKAVAGGLWLLEKLSPRQKLACTTVMEHFTALLSEALLEDEALASLFDPEFLSIWQWHALEELEHKAVAYDLQELVGNDKKLRLQASYFVAGALLPPVMISWLYLIAREGKLTDRKDLSTGLQLILGKQGIVRRIIPKLPIYAARRFHPNKHDTTKLENTWREKLFGDQGSLLSSWRNQDYL